MDRKTVEIVLFQVVLYRDVPNNYDYLCRCSGGRSFCNWFRPQPFPLEPKRKYGRVSYIFDGDTLQIEGLKPRIRLWGVDAPEVGQKGSGAATSALEKLSKGKKVSCIPIDTDRYGRMVARVFLSDGREINCLLIGQGVAKQYRKYSKGFYDDC